MATSSMSTAASPPPFEGARIIVVMGVSSSGKTTVGQEIARRLHAPFLDADDYHSAANIKKMSAGIPLTDEDRWPWLESLGKALHEAAESKGVAVGACSALKRSYRDFQTKAAGEPVLFVYLDGSYELIDARSHNTSPWEAILKSRDCGCCGTPRNRMPPLAASMLLWAGRLCWATPHRPAGHPLPRGARVFQASRLHRPLAPLGRGPG